MNPSPANTAAAAISPSVLPSEPASHAPTDMRPQARHLYSRFCARLSKASLVLAVLGLAGIILSVQAQVVGRYVLNDTPTWAEPLALQLVLFVTAFGVAVGVRDAGHIGLDSMLALLPDVWRHRAELLIHALVALFGAVMAHSGLIWCRLKWSELDPMLHVPEGIDYLALVIAGVLIVLFSTEHFIALLRGEDVQPAWH